MKNGSWIALCSAALLVLGSGAASAHDRTYPNARHLATPGIDHHRARQEQRIVQGLRSGELTRHEARRLERQQRHISRLQQQARADGVVTRQERRDIRVAQQRAGRAIYNQKHDHQRY